MIYYYNIICNSINYYCELNGISKPCFKIRNSKVPTINIFTYTYITSFVHVYNNNIYLMLFMTL